MADQPVAAPAQTPYGIELFRNPRLNRSTAFPHQARNRLGLLGRVPEQVETEDMQLRRVLQQRTMQNRGR